MNFTIEKSLEIFNHTPNILNTMLQDISDDWTLHNEGAKTWSMYDIIGHLIHAEKTDWITRAEIILSEKTDKTFEPFDRFAQIKESEGKSLTQLLDEFKIIRKNIATLLSKDLSDKNLQEKGTHPALGEVSLIELLATWVVHDLNHIAQIARVMAYQYKAEVGPWMKYLRILQP